MKNKKRKETLHHSHGRTWLIPRGIDALPHGVELNCGGALFYLNRYGGYIETKYPNWLRGGSYVFFKLTHQQIIRNEGIGKFQPFI